MMIRACAMGAILMLSPLFAGEPDVSVQERVKQLVTKLDSDDFNVRVQAVELARQLPVEALPLVETALAEAKGNPELQQGLTKARAILASAVRRRAREERENAFLAWNKKTMAEAYKQVGKKNPKWDTEAIDALERMATVWAKLGKAPIEDQQAVYGLALTAVRAGCDDALVVYVQARAFESMPRRDFKVSMAQHLDAAQKMYTSGYHPIRKAFASARAANVLAYSEEKLSDATRAQAFKYFDQALENAAEGFKDKELGENIVKDFWGVMMPTHLKLDSDRKNAIDKVFGVVDKARPDDPLLLVLKAEAYTDYAWDARGKGWANTVTEQGWKLMRERLVIAEQLLERAWQLDPTRPDAAVQMITVELGQGKGRPRMETWFKRAMEADPDCLAACNNKLYYLEPKWYGSAEDMIEFGRECLKTGNWEARLPSMLVDAHFKLSAYEKDYTQYFRNPAVWPDLKAVYDGYLKHRPENHFDRTWYARCAALCGQYDIAHEQFKILGDNVQQRAFKNRDELEMLRRTSAERAIKK